MERNRLAEALAEIDYARAEAERTRYLAAIEALGNAITQLHILVLAEGQPVI